MDTLFMVLCLQKVLIDVVPVSPEKITLYAHQHYYVYAEKESNLVNIALLVRVYYNLNVIPIGQHVLLFFFY